MPSLNVDIWSEIAPLVPLNTLKLMAILCKESNEAVRQFTHGVPLRSLHSRMDGWAILFLVGNQTRVPRRLWVDGGVPLSQVLEWRQGWAGLKQTIQIQKLRMERWQVRNAKRKERKERKCALR